jgi:hypothetical protein
MRCSQCLVRSVWDRAGPLFTWSAARGPLPGVRGRRCRAVATRRCRSVLGALRTARDKATLLARLRQCEVLGLRMADMRAARRLFVAEARAVTSGWSRSSAG